MAAVLGVDDAGRRRYVVVASAAPAATTALAGMAAEMGARVWRRDGRWDWPTHSLSLPGGPGVATGGLSRCSCQRKLGLNLGQGQFKPDASHRWGGPTMVQRSGRTTLDAGECYSCDGARKDCGV
jgi:hypothetical protein